MRVAKKESAPGLDPRERHVHRFLWPRKACHMLTLNPLPASVHEDFVSASAQAALPDDMLTAIALAVAIMLMAFALEALKNIIGSFWTMVRPALRLASLLAVALGLIVVALVVQLRLL
ncbi:hypothetical protein AB0M20_22820 [Actinoplanes sp. NPDC051633]|uniref:hypothetical protein n=1 Tax=Actinoplanes sp. NPDC051633 TaxID=3155670 RepID=UPI003413D54B